MMDRLGKDASFDWYFCLACFFIALAVIAITDALVYSSVATDAPLSAPVPTAQAHVNRTDVESLAKKLRASDLNAGAVSSAALRDPAGR